ncbi:MAG: hypothetical protein ACR2N3_11335 [Pyrinomonadaceae bacterium]
MVLTDKEIFNLEMTVSNPVTLILETKGINRAMAEKRRREMTVTNRRAIIDFNRVTVENFNRAKINFNRAMAAAVDFNPEIRGIRRDATSVPIIVLIIVPAEDLRRAEILFRAENPFRPGKESRNQKFTTRCR